MADKNKSGYEIRMDMLYLAKDYMDQQYNLQLEYAQKMIEAGKATLNDLPKMYDIKELQEKAMELYSFVQKKD